LEGVIDWLKTGKGKVAAVSMLDNNLKNFCSFRVTFCYWLVLQVKMFPWNMTIIW